MCPECFEAQFTHDNPNLLCERCAAAREQGDWVPVGVVYAKVSHQHDHCLNCGNCLDETMPRAGRLCGPCVGWEPTGDKLVRDAGPSYVDEGIQGLEKLLAAAAHDDPPHHTPDGEE